MREVLVLHLLTKCFEIIDKHFHPMEHVWHTLIFLHLETNKFLLENVYLCTLYCLGALEWFFQASWAIWMFLICSNVLWSISWWMALRAMSLFWRSTLAGVGFSRSAISILVSTTFHTLLLIDLICTTFHTFLFWFHLWLLIWIIYAIKLGWLLSFVDLSHFDTEGC